MIYCSNLRNYIFMINSGWPSPLILISLSFICTTTSNSHILYSVLFFRSPKGDQTLIFAPLLFLYSPATLLLLTNPRGKKTWSFSKYSLTIYHWQDFRVKSILKGFFLQPKSNLMLGVCRRGIECFHDNFIATVFSNWTLSLRSCIKTT